MPETMPASLPPQLSHLAAEISPHLLELLPEAVFICGKDRLIRFANPAFQSVFNLDNPPEALPLDELMITQTNLAPVPLDDQGFQDLGVRVCRPASRLFLASLDLHPLSSDYWLGLLSRFHGEDSPSGQATDVERRYSEVIEEIPAGVVVHGAQSEILQANSQACSILGLTRQQMLGLEAIDETWQFIHDDGRPMAPEEYPVSRVLSSGHRIRNVVVGIKRCDSATVWVICNAFPILNEHRTLCEVVVCFTDVTELKQAEHALRQSEERLRLVLQGSRDAPWDWNLQHNSMYYSPRWWQMIGRKPDELTATPDLWRSLLPASDSERVGTLLEGLINSRVESFEFEFSLQHKDGHFIPMLARGFILRDRNGEALRISGTNTDLTERKEAEARIHQLAYFDELTALPNRRLLMERLRQALLSGKRKALWGALLFIDLDNFKGLNDAMGHAEGDLLLQQVARRLLHCVREDDCVARLGGDEFIIMLEELGADATDAALRAESISQKILDELNRPYLVQARPYRITSSIGVAMFNGEQSALELLQQADVAMYQSKFEGRNTHRFFDPSMQAAVMHRVALENDLRESLDNREMLLHYQPQVGVDGNVTGAEALLRWQHSARGMVSPSDFIPLAESTGLILPLGRWVLRQACQQLARWAHHSVFGQLTLAVNVSAQQMHQERFVDEVKDILAETGAPANRLKLELTESSLARDIESLIVKMQALNSCGIRFSLDDFGTGYSSLTYLRRFPISQLKIDQSFVRDLPEDKSQADLTCLIIALAQKLALEVIAEGVETPEQKRFLQDNECFAYQGYFFGKPMPIEEFEVFCHANRRRAG